MRTSSRTVLGGLLAAFLAGGCGKSEPGGPAPDPNVPLAGDPKPQPNPGPGPNPISALPALPVPAAATWEMDPGKHQIPAGLAAGQLAGEPFTPEVQVQGDTLLFRTLKNGLVERQIAVTLFLEPGRTIEGRKLVVDPVASPGADVPVVVVTLPHSGSGPPPGAPPFFEKGYALTLETGTRGNGTLPGKIYLTLPGEPKTFLAGTFAAEWVRTAAEPPGPADAPFVAGKVSVPGVPSPEVRVGYVRASADGPIVLDMLGTAFTTPGIALRSESYRPRTSLLVSGGTDQPGRYEHTRLEPGRYLVFAGVKGGPTAWAWVTVAPGAQLAADLTVEPAKAGGLEVTLPAGGTTPVTLVPADDPARPWPDALATTAATILEFEAKPTNGVATFAKLGSGKYEVRSGDLSGTADVTPGQTAKITLVPKK